VAKFAGSLLLGEKPYYSAEVCGRLCVVAGNCGRNRIFPVAGVQSEKSLADKPEHGAIIGEEKAKSKMGSTTVRNRLTRNK
jgi:hypothetical protein